MRAAGNLLFLSIKSAERLNTMKCPKCTGMMVMQSFFNQSVNFEGWKCLNCGNVIEKKKVTIKTDVFGVFYQRQKNKDENS